MDDSKIDRCTRIQKLKEVDHWGNDENFGKTQLTQRVERLQNMKIEDPNRWV